jgi:XRE family aerobic/anaerobic benzoate catabolism transcriptional regulator
VWLQASAEEHMARVAAQGDTRPMAQSNEAMADLRRILAGRAAFYAKADASFDTSGRSEAESFAGLLQLVSELLKRPAAALTPHVAKRMQKTA